MKKIATILLIVIAVSTLFLTTACAPDAADDKVATTSDIAAAVIGSGFFPDMNKLGLEDLSGYYFGIDLSGVVDATSYVSSSGEFPDEVTIIKTDSSDTTLNRLEAFFKNWVEDRLEKWTEYNPDEVYKLADAFVEAREGYVVVLVCDRPGLAKKAFYNFLY